MPGVGFDLTFYSPSKPVILGSSQTGTSAWHGGVCRMLPGWSYKLHMSWGHPWTGCQVPIHIVCTPALHQPMESTPQKSTCLLERLSGWYGCEYGGWRMDGVQRIGDGTHHICAPLCKHPSILWTVTVACGVLWGWGCRHPEAAYLEQLDSSHSMHAPQFCLSDCSHDLIFPLWILSWSRICPLHPLSTPPPPKKKTDERSKQIYTGF